MVHLGDITAISGYDAPVVDVVIGGSPCQDLSIAGRRAGLAGERSGLFMEQIRIVKEMRDADIRRGRTGQFVRPRFMVWENVVGAFSSNKGDDFRVVLEEVIRVAEPDAPDVPLPPKGKWPLADTWYGDGWSVAYRVLDAQFWGVPQRRRRIALVADFGGHAAPEILFVRKGVCGDIAEGGAAGEETAAGVGSGAGETISFQERAGKPGGGKGILIQKNRTRALSTLNNQYVFDARGNGDGRTAAVHDVRTTNIYGKDVIPTLVSSAFKGPGNTQDGFCVYDARGSGDGKTACTLTGNHENRVMDYMEIIARPLLASEHDPHREDMATYPMTDGYARRLTPLECERLQGYPDGWTDIGPWTDSAGKPHKESSDAARYKALGNSIALPPWAWLLKRLCGCYERTATMASLFDGIGGFPLIWEKLNGPGTCLWASEIEEFPIAVTKFHFRGGGSHE